MTNWRRFSYFPQKTGSDITCRLSPMETICIKYQKTVKFSGKNKKNISINHLLTFLPRVHEGLNQPAQSVQDILCAYSTVSTDFVSRQ